MSLANKSPQRPTSAILLAMLSATLSVLAISVVTAHRADDSQTLGQKSEGWIYIPCNDINRCRENVPQTTAHSYFSLVHMTQQLLCNALEHIGNYGAYHYCELEERALEYQRERWGGPVEIDECYFTFQSSYNSDSSDDRDEEKVRRIFQSYEPNITSALKDCATVVAYGCSLLRYGYANAKAWNLLCLFVNEAMVIMDE